ncbi:MAG: sensor domain-containing diguanylate cyclase [Betaproteobacteria bacterium]|nr:sensor domain-containing diguanylate cyclase [Betaproteobacteria bacterium]
MPVDPSQSDPANVDVPAALDAETAARLSALRNYCVLDTGHEERFDDLTCLAASICDTPVSLVSLVDLKRLFFKSTFGLDVREMSYSDNFCNHAIRQREIFEVSDARVDPRFAAHPLVVDPPRVRFYAGAPLVTPQGVAVGTLCVIDFVPRQLDERQRKSLRLLARQVISQFEINLQAMRDPLTSLYNRRQLEESLQREILRSAGSDAPIGVMVVDVDHFKRVNDTLGHESGDRALQVLAGELVACVREEDIVCRLGGEEFAVILPGADAETLTERAEAMRRRIERTALRVGQHELRLTVSIGLAVYPGEGESDVALLRAADAALYRAKAEGRNRVVLGLSR